MFGVNARFLIMQLLVTCTPLLLWLVPALVALISLRSKPVAGTARAVWALVIVVIPVLGAAAYFIASPEPHLSQPPASG